MAIKDDIRADLKEAMKSGDTTTRDTLRMILAAVMHEQTTGKEASEITDEEFITLLAREAKKRNEAASIFAEQNRPELADKELAEAEVISRYLPQQLSDEELHELISQVIAQLGITEPTNKDFGAIMKNSKEKAAGKADGARISQAVKTIISGK